MWIGLNSLSCHVFNSLTRVITAYFSKDRSFFTLLLLHALKTGYFSSFEPLRTVLCRCGLWVAKFLGKEKNTHAMLMFTSLRQNVKWLLCMPLTQDMLLSLAMLARSHHVPPKLQLHSSAYSKTSPAYQARATRPTTANP